MNSKIMIDVDVHRQEHIKVRFAPTEDVRDKLVKMFLQTAAPISDNRLTVLDGYCRLTILEHNADGSIVAVIVPIRPIDMPVHFESIQENANKFKTLSPGA